MVFSICYRYKIIESGNGVGNNEPRADGSRFEEGVKITAPLHSQSLGGTAHNILYLSPSFCYNALRLAQTFTNVISGFHWGAHSASWANMEEKKRQKQVVRKQPTQPEQNKLHTRVPYTTYS